MDNPTQVTIFMTDVIRYSVVDPFALGEDIPSEAYPPVAVGLTPEGHVSFSSQQR